MSTSQLHCSVIVDAPQAVQILHYLHVRIVQPIAFLLVHDRRRIVVVRISERCELERHCQWLLSLMANALGGLKATIELVFPQ